MATETKMDPIEVLMKEGVLYRIDKHCWWGKSIKCRDGEVNPDAPQDVLDGIKTLVNPKKLAPIRAAQSKAERALKKYGFSYLGLRGVFYVPKALISLADTVVAEAEIEHSEAVVYFMKSYEKHRQDWKKRSGKFYDSSLYPTYDALKDEGFTFKAKKFSINVPDKKYGVLDDAEYKSELKKMREEAREFIDYTLSVIASRFYSMVKSLEDKLKTGKPIRKQTLDAMQAFGESFDSMNITNHKELKNLVNKCFKIVGNVDPEDFKGSDEDTKALRENIGKSISELANQFTKSSDKRLKRAIDF